MIELLAILVALVVMLLVGVGTSVAALWLDHNMRIQRWIERAIMAFNARDFDVAEQNYRKLDAFHHRLRDATQRTAIEFVSAHGIGLCRQNLDDHAEAEERFVAALQLLDDGVEQPLGIRGSILAELSTTQLIQRKSEACRESLRQLRECCKTATEEDVEGIVEWITGAANGAAYRDLNKHAFDIAGIAQSVLEKTDAWHDGLLAHTQITLASFHMLHCEYGPARKLIETAIETTGEQLELIDAEKAWFYLGNIHFLSADFPKAIKAHERCREIRAELKGPEHWDTAGSISAIADAWRGYGDYRKAIESSNDAWEMICVGLPAGDRVRAAMAINRSMLLVNLGRFSEAAELLSEAHSVAENTAGKSMLACVTLIKGISATTQLQYDNADRLLSEALAIAEDVYGKGYRMTCDYLAIYSDNLRRQQRYDEAEETINRALAIRNALPDVSVMDLADGLGIQADLYVATNRLELAEEAILRTEELVTDRVAPTHLIFADIAQTKGGIFHKHQRYAEAIDCFRQARSVRVKVQQLDHPRLAELFEAHASSLECVGQQAKAEKLRKQARQTRLRYST